MPNSDDKKVFRTVISEQIKDQLMEEIFQHKYKPGDRLVESALAKELNVSQTSVREALRSLVAMGFLESEPFKGITVRSLSRQDLWEVYTVRAALESLAAAQAAQRITAEQIAELTLTRPKALNSINRQMLQEHEYALEVVLQEMMDRCRELGLRAPSTHRQLLTDLAILLAARGVEYVYRRREWHVV